MSGVSKLSEKKPVGEAAPAASKSQMDQSHDRDRDGRASDERTSSSLDSISRLIGAVSAEIDALKREREAAQIRNARMRLGAIYARARLEKRVNAEDAR